MSESISRSSLGVRLPWSTTSAAVDGRFFTRSTISHELSSGNVDAAANVAGATSCFTGDIEAALLGPGWVGETGESSEVGRFSGEPNRLDRRTEKEGKWQLSN